MRDYLLTLHQKPDHHKKRFSLAVASGVTLLIFTIWSYANFSPATETVAEVVPDTSATAESPLESIRASAVESLKYLTGQLDKAKQGLDSVDIQNSYTQVRDDALTPSPSAPLTNY